ncbi:MAG: class I SAM-dependent methyltransferase [Methanophagales archaeon]|nr:class I SAM-dependent methyltransferase [Methanophagales archaeon]
MKVVQKRDNKTLISVSLSTSKTEEAKKRMQKISERMGFQHANAANLPFEDEYFNLVVSMLSLHHWLRGKDLRMHKRDLLCS